MTLLYHRATSIIPVYSTNLFVLSNSNSPLRVVWSSNSAFLDYLHSYFGRVLLPLTQPLCTPEKEGISRRCVVYLYFICFPANEHLPACQMPNGISPPPRRPSHSFAQRYFPRENSYRVSTPCQIYSTFFSPAAAVFGELVYFAAASASASASIQSNFHFPGRWLKTEKHLLREHDSILPFWM